MTARILLTAVVAGIVCVHALAAPPPPAKPVAAPAKPAAAPAGPWAKVPALPTACYSGQDKWREQYDAAMAAVRNDHSRQDDINGAIHQNSVDAFGADPMAVAARMQQKMMEDPANAQKMMEQMMQQQQQAQAEAPAKMQREQQIEAESKTLLKRYEAALETAMGSGNARLDALLKKYKPSVEGAFDLWMRYGESGEPGWVEPERHAILKQWDGAYAATCPQWWGANGQFHAYLKRYRDFLVQERIPYDKKGDDMKLKSYQDMGHPTQGWRTTSDYKGVEDYLNMAFTLFTSREDAPRCGGPVSCR